MTNDIRTTADHLVGNLYFNLNAVPVIAGRLHPDDMPDGPAASIYREMCRLHMSADKTLSAGALESALRAVDFDFGYLSDVQSRILGDSREALVEYADTINAWADSRDAQKKIAGALQALQDGDSAESVVPDLMQSLSQDNRAASQQGRYIEDVMEDLRKQVEKWRAGEKDEGIDTGFRDLDRIVNLVPGELTLVAARPSMGKTAIAIQIAENVARSDVDGQVVIFSAEMTDDSLALRMAASHAGVNSHRIRNTYADPDEYDKLLRATQNWPHGKIYIDDSSHITTDQMYYRTAMLNAQKPVSLVIFDFVELGADRPDRRSDGEEQRISQISRGLKSIAKNLNVPVVALSQLNRQVENRADKLPRLADLRYSGMLEQVSDVVIFLMRPEYYIKREESCFTEDLDHEQGVCYAIVAKHRNGPVGRANLQFTEKYTRFGNLVKVNLNGHRERSHA